ncbi:hypothetical protein B0H11DRAFT_1730397 [Mycena galericulata]|nr:hypothetical protein B0H11DRAFT_1730397 [Mycena galericulata]
MYNDVEERRHMRSATEGMPLRDARGPRMMLEAIIHGMISYMNLLLAGWQHRDVSNSNILLVPAFHVANGPPHDEARRYQLEYCRGIITDSDQAVHSSSRKTSRDIATHPSSTLPFVSYHLLEAWIEGENRPHTALDDLESFFWVFLWELLHKGNELGRLTPTDTRFFYSLQDASLGNLLSHKGSIILECSRRYQPFIPVGPLLKEWITVMQDAQLSLSNLLAGGLSAELGGDSKEKVETLCLETGRKCVAMGLKYLPQLDEDWSVKKVTQSENDVCARSMLNERF